MQCREGFGRAPTCSRCSASGGVPCEPYPPNPPEGPDEADCLVILGRPDPPAPPPVPCPSRPSSPPSRRSPTIRPGAASSTSTARWRRSSTIRRGPPAARGPRRARRLVPHLGASRSSAVGPRIPARPARRRRPRPRRGSTGSSGGRRRGGGPPAVPWTAPIGRSRRRRRCACRVPTCSSSARVTSRSRCTGAAPPRRPRRRPPSPRQPAPRARGTVAWPHGGGAAPTRPGRQGHGHPRLVAAVAGWRSPATTPATCRRSRRSTGASPTAGSTAVRIGVRPTEAPPGCSMPTWWSTGLPAARLGTRRWPSRSSRASQCRGRVTARSEVAGDGRRRRRVRRRHRRVVGAIGGSWSTSNGCTATPRGELVERARLG